MSNGPNSTTSIAFISALRRIAYGTIEDAYRGMWHNWCEAQAKSHDEDRADQAMAPEAAEALARRLLDEKSIDAAEGVLQLLLERAPDRGMCWFLLGRVYHARGDDDAAIDFLRKAVERDATLSFAHNDLGILLQQRGRLAEAEECYRRAIDRNKGFAEAMSNLGAVLAARGRLEDAAAWYDRAIAADAEYAPAHNHLGAALCKLDRSDEAANYHRQAIALKPDFAEAHYNLGVALQAQGGLVEALASYEKAIELRSDYIDAHRNRAFALLATGRYTEGWREHEWRWRRKEQPPRNFAQPLWRGEPLAGRTILLHAEQGIGDTLQFMRYVPYVGQIADRVILQVQPPLLRLAGGRFAGTAEVISGKRGTTGLRRTLATNVVAALPSAPPSRPSRLRRCTRATWRSRHVGATSSETESIKIGLVWPAIPAEERSTCSIRP